MKFYTILDLSVDPATPVGVVLEGDSGEMAGAALAGSLDESTSPYRIIHELAQGQITQVLPRGADRIKVVMSPGDPGFSAALVSALRPPLAPGPRGNVTRVGPPVDMLRRVWEQIAPGAEMPPVVSI